jgi:molybdenum cofactor synthesis domain-containing protein
VRACAARPGEKLRRGRDFEYVDTGDPIPEPFDSVVKIEEVRELGEDTVEIERAPSPGMHVRALGRILRAEPWSCPQGLISPPKRSQRCWPRATSPSGSKSQPKIVFIPTGSELVPPEREPAVGEIVETNSQLVKGLVSRWGGAVTVTESVPNELAILRSAVREALARFDIVLVGAGTSKGRGDWVAQVVRELGEVVVHGVAYHPGHPVLLGVCEQKPVVGLPGYPVATWLALQLFVRPVLERYYYGQERPRLSVWAPPGPADQVRARVSGVCARAPGALARWLLAGPSQAGRGEQALHARAHRWLDRSPPGRGEPARGHARRGEAHNTLRSRPYQREHILLQILLRDALNIFSGHGLDELGVVRVHLVAHPKGLVPAQIPRGGGSVVSCSMR